MDNILEMVNKACEQSEKLLSLANESQWEELELLQSSHAELIQQLATINFTVDDAQLARPLLEKIQLMDKQTEMLAINRKDEIVKLKQQRDKGDKMKKAFTTFK